jgi:hypothetical protein
MGDAKRRKKLDPNYGTTPHSRKNDDIDRFEISLKSEVKDSWITVQVIDTLTLKKAILPFHLYLIGTKAYAEVGIDPDRITEDGWVAENIDTLSPKICQMVYLDKKLIIVNPPT